MISINHVERAVLLTIESDIYTDGIFLDKENWNRVEINIVRLQRENELLREEMDRIIESVQSLGY